ncbi:hypothetical protein QQF64_031253 [Cirrhinus molitorella]|uniref:Secreted protein n=1 Tax=Cirrhinus molitorella TaxID=172907 RepID=A0ABR3MWH8_9TELE
MMRRRMMMMMIVSGCVYQLSHTPTSAPPLCRTPATPPETPTAPRMRVVYVTSQSGGRGCTTSMRTSGSSCPEGGLKECGIFDHAGYFLASIHKFTDDINKQLLPWEPSPSKRRASCDDGDTEETVCKC